MAWDAYYRYGDGDEAVEIINAARVLAYANALGLHWVKDAGTGSNVEMLPVLLGDGAYTYPAIDNAPWYDPDVPESANFAGLLPLSVGGIEDSTRESEVFEFTNDGGNPGTLRHATKGVVFSAALVGVNEAAVEYGFRWLKRALLRRQCAPGSMVACTGERLTYARHEPVDIWGGDSSGSVFDGGSPYSSGSGGSSGVGGTLDGGGPTTVYPDGTPLPTWTDHYETHLNNVRFTRGPVINNKRTLGGCNGAVWIVSFTAVAGDSFEYGNNRPVLSNAVTKIEADQSPYLPGLDGVYGETTYPYATCPVEITTPVFDPTYSPVTPPPQAPDLMPGGFVFPSGTQNRMYVEIPASLVPLWDEVRPVIILTAGEVERRMIRLRFYDGDVEPDTNCGDVGQYIVSYLPPDHTLIIDTAREAVYVYAEDGVVRRADSLVYGPEAKPVRWFGLSCGDSYLLAVDSDNPIDGFDLDLDLVPRSA